MKITINGTSKDLADITYLSDIIAIYCKEPKHIISEVNGHIIPCELWANTALKEGDTIELVAFVGGG